MRNMCPAHLIFLEFFILIILDEDYSLLSSSLFSLILKSTVLEINIRSYTSNVKCSPNIFCGYGCIPESDQVPIKGRTLSTVGVLRIRFN
jgi:hypothetical protein